MQEFGKVLVGLGVVLCVVGGLLWAGVGRAWLGRLPGDIHIEKGPVTFHFPLMTCALLSLLLSILGALWNRLK